MPLRESSHTPKARISSQNRRGDLGGDPPGGENGTVLCHEDMDSMHSRDLRNYADSMMQLAGPSTELRAATPSDRLLLHHHQ